MNKLKISLCLWMAFSSMAIFAQQTFPVLNPESCTSIMVGKQASTDGSVITSHTYDSNYRTWIDIVPAASYDHDTTLAVYSGRMHTEYDKGTRGMVLKGSIPEARATYQFVNTAYPCLNEKQLGIGETTITGRKELVNEKGMFMIEELEKIALQRCTTAREAIRLMGDLVKQYGYGDWGECLTIADPKEVWHFEIFGEGPDRIGGVWAAIRIPDDHVGVSANNPRISKVDPKDTENGMASDNVFEVAKRMGFWDGKKPFRCWEAYQGGNYSKEYKNFGLREFFIFSKLAPSKGFKYSDEELPISVKPDKQVDVTEVMALLRETYEGTEYDPVKNLKVAVKNKCVVTSGNYQRYFVVDGERYCHIIDPDTLMPADYFASVSIITDDSGKADALSTAIYNMPLEEGIAFVNGMENVEALWIMEDGSMHYSEHFQTYRAE